MSTPLKPSPWSTTTTEIARWASGAEKWAPKALRIALAVSVPTAATIALVAIAVTLLRQRAEKCSRRTRVTFRMLPTETFDPTTEEVTRFASQLARIRPAVALAPRRAASLRVTLRTQDGRVVHEITGPASAASVLRMGGYSQVELHRLDDAPDEETNERMNA